MQQYRLRRLAWAGPVATGIAIAANFLYYEVTRSLGETYLIPLDADGSQFVQMPVLMPLLGALAVGLLATLFFGVLIRVARKPVIVFLSVGVTALVLSFGGTFSIPAAAERTKLLLSGLNVVSAVCIVGGILLLGREKPEQVIQ